MNRTCRMAVVTAPGTVEFQERCLPEMGDRDVLVEIKAAAICGSDLHVFKGLHPSAALPITVGHEAAGQVIEIGRAVTNHAVGDRVTIEPIITCGKCEFCERGLYHLCTSVSFKYRHGQGAFAPYFVASEDRIHRLPDNISYEEGALIEPLSVALHAVKKSGVRVGESCAVFGAGAIGLLVAMLAGRITGSRVFVSDINPFRLQRAAEMGARAINSRELDPLQVILEETRQLGVDHSFEAVGLEATLVPALKCLKKGGSATLLGIFEKLDSTLPINMFVQREIRLGGSQGYCWDFQDSISLLANGSLNLLPLITHRLDLADLQRGFELSLDPRANSLKVVVVPEPA